MFYFIQSFLQVVPEFFLHILGHILCICLTIFHKKLGVHFAGIRMFFNQCVHKRLREFRIIPFIVPVPAVTYHVHKKICIEFLPVPCRNLGAFHSSFRIISIYMKNRRMQGCSQRSAIIEIRCKSYLVIDHKMNGSTSIVTFEITHLQYLVYDTLARQGGVTMD